MLSSGKGVETLDAQETSAKMLRLLSQLAVALLAILPLLLFLWFPWPIALLLCISTYISAPILRQRWIAHRRATPVYQPPAHLPIPEEPPSYQQGYQAQEPIQPSTWSPLSVLSPQSSEPQPKQDSPGVIYEQPLVQYPDQPSL